MVACMVISYMKLHTWQNITCAEVEHRQQSIEDVLFVSSNEYYCRHHFVILVSCFFIYCWVLLHQCSYTWTAALGAGALLRPSQFRIETGEKSRVP